MLYAATNKGLARYNGSTVEIIPIPGENELSITSLGQDKYGNIYFAGFQGGVWCYTGTEVFLIKRLRDIQYGYPSLKVYADSLVLFSRNSKSFYTFHAPHKKIDSVIVTNNRTGSELLSFFDHNDEEVFFRSGGYKYSYSDGQIKLIASGSFLPKNEVVLNKSSFLLAIKVNVKAKKSSLEICYLKRINGKYSDIRSLSGVNGARLLSAEVFENQLYLMTDKGVYIYNEKFEKQGHWFKDLNTSHLQQDANGTIWVATLEKGIIAIPNSKVELQTSIFGSGSGIVSNILRSVSGLSYVKSTGYNEWPKGKKLKRALGRRVFVYKTEQFPNTLSFMSTKNSFAYKQTMIPSIKELSMGNAFKWISYFSEADDYLVSSSGGFNYYGSDAQIKNFTKKYNYKKVIRFDGKLFGKKSSVQISTKKTYTHYFNRKSGLIYLGTRKGFYIFTPNRKEVELKWKNESIQSDFLYPTTDGDVVWSGGRSGLYKLENDVVKKHWNKQSGLLHTRIDRLRQQGDTLIIIFEKGVQLFTESAGVYATYSSANYLPNAMCIDAALYGGQLYVSTEKGVYALPTELGDVEIPRVGIAGVWSTGNKNLTGQKIEYKNNTLLFRINGASLNSRKQFRYEYRLLPNAKDWVSQSSANNEVRFNSLQEGSYLFEVRVVTDFAKSNIAEYQFAIASPWYRSLLFYILCALLTLAIFGTFFYIRIRRIRRQAEYDKRIKQSEVTAIKAQMNPHFVFNALNSLQNLVLKKDFESTNEYLGLFSDLIRKTLLHSGKDKISLAEEIEMLTLYLDLEKLRFRDSIVIQFTVDLRTEDLEDIGLPPMLIQPYIENVFKHGLLHKEGSKQLKLTVKRNNNMLLVEIVDNGVGRKKAAALKSRNTNIGFSSGANKKRMNLLSELYKEQLKVSIRDAFPEQEDCGTYVLLQFPIIEYA